jgi:hypothetical protein
VFVFNFFDELRRIAPGGTVAPDRVFRSWEQAERLSMPGANCA